MVLALVSYPSFPCQADKCCDEMQPSGSLCAWRAPNVSTDGAPALSELRGPAEAPGQ